MPPRPAPPDDGHDDGSAGAGRPRTVLWWVALACGVVAGWLAAGPGVEVDLQLFRVSAHNPVPLAIAAALAVVVALARRRRRAVAVDLPALADDLRRHARWWAAGLACAVTIVAVAWNTWTIGGSDSHCYAAQARAFAEGRLHLSQPLAGEAPWPDATRTFAPVGFLPSETTQTEFEPVCAPGYSLLIVPLVLLWPQLQFLVAPVCGGTLVLATFLLARRMSDEPLAAVGAALLCATAPVVLFQAMQPMTDVPAAALLSAAAVFGVAPRPRFGAAGVALGVCLVMRPNLLPVAVPFLAWTARHGTPALTRLALGVVPAGFVVLALNHLVYGAFWKTGYRDAAGLFSMSHVEANVRHFTVWLYETMTPVVFVGLAAPWLVGRADGARSQRDRAFALLAVVAAVAACYIAYRPFEEWWYLRFLLPAVPALCALASVAVFAAFSRVPRAAATLALIVVVLAAARCLHESAARHVFGLWRTEQRLSATADFLARTAPNVAALAIQPNGAISYGLRQPVLSWDSLEPDRLDTSIAWLRSRGFRPLIVVDPSEEQAFRRKFAAASTFGALDWPPAAVVYRAVRLFDPADRDRYLSGQPTGTRWIDPPRGRR